MADTPANIEDARKRREAEPHLEVSLELLSGLTDAGKSWAVRTPRGQKDPGHIKWDPKSADRGVSLSNLDAVRRGSGDNLGIHLFGDMVDVDVDTDNPFMVPALDYFLKHTPHTWGRASKPRSHRLYQLQTIEAYFDPTLLPFLRTIAKHEAVRLELRGGQQGNARYTLMPGSLHPSGEYYEWDNISAARVTPTIYKEVDLIKALRKACLVALIAPLMEEGNRHFMYMGFCGFLHRAMKSAEDLGIDPYEVMDKDDAREIVEGLIEVTGDDDYQDRIQTFESTWTKADNDAKVAGATDLASRVNMPELPRIMYSIMMDSQAMVEYEEFAEKRVIWDDKVVDLEALTIDGAVPIKSQDKFHLTHLHRKMQMPDGSMKPMSRIFVGSKTAKRVQAIGFDPTEETIYTVRRGDREHNELNLWTGWRIPPAETATEEQVEPFTTHIREIICSGNPEHYHWVMAWMADIFQYPNSKPGTALSIVGQPGSGKSFIGHHVLRKIIGYRHSAVVSDISAILGNFNQDSSAKLFIQCDEALSTRQKVDAHRMKALITDPRKRVEPKGIDAFEVNDYAQYLLTSNDITESVAILDGESDRRYSVLETNNKYATRNAETTPEEKQEYFGRLHKWADDEANLAALHRYFLNFQYKRETIRDPITSKARSETMQASAVGFADFLMEIAPLSNPFEQSDRPKLWWSHAPAKTGGHIETLDEWPELVNYAAIKKMYDKYTRGKRGATPMNEQQIVNWLKKEKLVPENMKSKRIRVTEGTEYDESTGEMSKIEMRATIRQWPKQQDILDMLRARYGFNPDMNFEEDTPSPSKSAKKARKEMDF